MDLTHGFLLLIIGTTISIVGMGIAYYIGSKEDKKEEKTEVQKFIKALKKGQ
jgi:preprotein translocase subunit YajC|tara:strand:+ start:601 stop:756 length:156 start_codon:yes stop_codon:yes gene_type:complete